MENSNWKISLIKAFYRCIDENQGEEITKIISNDFLDHDAQNIEKGLEELQHLIVALHKWFSNISHVLEQIHFIEENKIFVRWKMTGKHIGTFFDIPASNKNVVLYGHDLFKIDWEQIIEQRHIEQLLSLIHQIS